MAGVVGVAAALPSIFAWWRSGSTSAVSGQAWADLGVARKIPEGRWLGRPFQLERRNRWRDETFEGIVYLRRDGRDIEVRSPVCPHAACLVQIDGDGFRCRCHQSSFDADGNPLGGPAPRPLDVLEWKVKKGRLKVRYERFRPGVAQRDPLAV